MDSSDKKTVFQTEWFSVEEECFLAVDPKPFYRINCANSVIVLAQTEDGQFILIRQFRPAIKSLTLELPSGAIDPNESPMEAGSRELYEETGYICPQLISVGKGKIMLNRLNAEEYAFYAPKCIKDTAFSAPGGIETILVDPIDFKNLIMQGHFEQLAMLSLLILTDWKVGTNFVRPE